MLFDDLIEDIPSRESLSVFCGFLLVVAFPSEKVFTP